MFFLLSAYLISIRFDVFLVLLYLLAVRIRRRAYFLGPCLDGVQFLIHPFEHFWYRCHFVRDEVFHVLLESSHRFFQVVLSHVTRPCRVSSSLGLRLSHFLVFPSDFLIDHSAMLSE